MTRSTDAWGTDAGSLHIGLVNNMPDSALAATERQFRTLLSEAADGLAVRLSLFALPEVPRSDEAKRVIGNSYASMSALWNNRFDGLIVTGAEPVASHLSDEPFWPSLTRLIDWAEHSTYSSVWSCLAAHAAVLHLDGIRRRPLGQKLCGVFPSARVSEHALTTGIPDRFAMPHSRWNDLPGDALAGCGYRVLTQLNNGGVDAFIKHRKSLFVFFQGHPEYEAASLLGEYRRDIRRYLARERDGYPTMPHGYFDEDATAALTVLEERAVADRSLQSFADFTPALRAAGMKSTWRCEAVLFYRNWLRCLSEKKNTVEFTFQNALAAEGRRVAPQVEAG